MRNALAAGMAIALGLVLSTTARAALIEVDSLVDIGARGICTLRDAITAPTQRPQSMPALLGPAPCPSSA
ncbi:MAG: hypothetical protein JO071_09660 [Deltaproteobacteria bacterium]|nr:hypothetical protein [Deltaproteobacteria bacterium]